MYCKATARRAVRVDWSVCPSVDGRGRVQKKKPSALSDVELDYLCAMSTSYLYSSFAIGVEGEYTQRPLGL